MDYSTGEETSEITQQQEIPVFSTTEIEQFKKIREQENWEEMEDARGLIEDEDIEAFAKIKNNQFSERDIPERTSKDPFLKETESLFSEFKDNFTKEMNNGGGSERLRDYFPERIQKIASEVDPFSVMKEGVNKDTRKLVSKIALLQETINDYVANGGKMKNLSQLIENSADLNQATAFVYLESLCRQLLASNNDNHVKLVA